MRDDPKAIDNLKTLVLKTTLLLIRHRYLAHSLSEEGSKAGTEVLNCVRVLSRVLPYIYESDALRAWEASVFWGPISLEEVEKYAQKVPEYVEGGESLGSQLVHALVDLLFYTGFTLPWPDADIQDGRKGTVSYGLWQSGIACDTTIITSREYESRRTEILQLLLTLESKSIYVSPSKLRSSTPYLLRADQPPDEYIYSNIEAVGCIVTLRDKRRVQSLLCSLLNTVYLSIMYHGLQYTDS